MADDLTDGGRRNEGRCTTGKYRTVPVGSLRYVLNSHQVDTRQSQTRTRLDPGCVSSDRTGPATRDLVRVDLRRSHRRERCPLHRLQLLSVVHEMFRVHRDQAGNSRRQKQPYLVGTTHQRHQLISELTRRMEIG